MFEYFDCVDADIAAVAHALTAAVEDDAVDGGALGDAILRIDVQVRRLQALQLELTNVHDRGKAWQRDGARSAKEWHRDRRRLTAGEASRHVTTAVGLERLPTVAAKVAAGALTPEQAAVAAKACTGLSPDQVVQLDVLVAETGAAGNLRDVRDAVADFEHRLAPETLTERERVAHERRSIRFSRRADGCTSVQGDLDILGSETILTAMSVLASPRGRDDDRSVEQRHHDAFVDLAERALRHDHDLPDEGGRRPAVGVQASVETLQRAAGAPAARLEHVGPVSAETARQLACDADMHRIITRGRSEVLDLGRTTRVVSIGQRRALIARDRGCIGCGAPPGWTDAHHIIFWDDGGPTDLTNLVLLCRACHTGVHHRRWHVMQQPDGRIVVQRPTRHPSRPDREKRQRPQHAVAARQPAKQSTLI